MADTNNIHLTTKGKDKTPKIPAGAENVNKRVSITTEEIENGFLITKNWEINYTLDGKSDYLYYSKKWYSEKDPFAVRTELKTLIDSFK